MALSADIVAIMFLQVEMILLLLKRNWKGIHLLHFIMTIVCNSFLKIKNCYL